MKQSHTENDYSAECLGYRVHKGSNYRRKKKKSSDKRGRKSKKGRIVRRFKITLLPTDIQKECLSKDLEFFNAIYIYSVKRLSEDLQKKEDGYYHAYNIKKAEPGTYSNKVQGLVPHTPKYIMDSQNSLIEDNQWMKGCTYQVSYRATLKVFEEFLLPDEEKVFASGNTFEAKICYRVQNGFLYLKKYDQMIEIKESLPKGSLEGIQITKNGDKWSAIVELLEPHDKVEDIKESWRGILETDTKPSVLHVDEVQDAVLTANAEKFNQIANDILKKNQSLKQNFEGKLRGYQKRFIDKYDDVGLVNMGFVAANAREHKYRGHQKAPPISRNYIALAEGFYIKNDILHLKKWNMAIPLGKNHRLRSKWYDYIVIIKDSKGIWKVYGKKQKRNIFRNICRIFRFFSLHEELPF